MGEPLPGGTLLVQAEQGLGDTLQFCRYLAPLRQRSGARIIFQAQPRLLPLLSSCTGVDVLVPFGANVDSWDRRVDLLSLPHLLRDQIPEPQPLGAYLRPDDARLTTWRHRLRRRKKLRIALAWQGNPEGYLASRRSIPFETLLPLFQISSDLEFVIVQKFDGRETLARHSDLGFIDLDRENVDFQDTAAILACSDILLTSDSASVHLGGALGVETWLMRMRVPDWRWTMGPDCPWYRSVRFFRQGQDHAWGPVVADVAQALRLRLTSGSGAA